MWHVDPMVAPKPRKVVTPKAELLKPPVSGIHLPVVLPREPEKSSSDWIIILTMFLIFSFAIFFSRSVDFDFTNKLSSDLVISEVKVDHHKDTDKMVMRYKIENEGDHTAQMPEILIRIFDAEHKLLKTYKMIGGEAELEPHQHLKFRTEFVGIPVNADIIDVTIGSKLDFIFK